MSRGSSPPDSRFSKVLSAGVSPASLQTASPLETQEIYLALCDLLLLKKRHGKILNFFLKKIVFNSHIKKPRRASQWAPKDSQNQSPGSRQWRLSTSHLFSRQSDASKKERPQNREPPITAEDLPVLKERLYRTS